MPETKNKLIKNIPLQVIIKLAAKGKTRASLSVRIRAAIRFFADMNEASFDRLIAKQITQEATEKIK